MRDKWYLSPTTSVSPSFYGLFETLTTHRWRDVSRFPVWALDNGRFSLVKNQPALNPKWTLKKWRSSLDCYLDKDIKTCLFCCVPDVPLDANETTKLYSIYIDEVVQRGYKPAFVLQDGHTLQDVKDIFENHALSALFVGGSTSFKYSRDVYDIVMWGREVGLHNHLGRANCMNRIESLYYFDSFDGTTLTRSFARPHTYRINRAMSMARGKDLTLRMFI